MLSDISKGGDIIAELSREDQFQLEAYRTLREMSVQTGLVALNMARWGALLFVGTFLYVWQDPQPRIGCQAFVLCGSGLLMYFLIYLQKKQSFLMDTPFRLMRNIEGKLGFRAHKELYDAVTENKTRGKQRKWIFRINWAAFGLICLNLFYVAIQLCIEMLKRPMRESIGKKRTENHLSLFSQIRCAA